ncbi:MAG: hypothetical protein K0B08_01685 [Bacteroidales bacterium]|nr:hypothetical protein [Bacteroidales bacterium]
MRKLIICCITLTISVLSSLYIIAQEEDQKIWYNTVSVPPSPNAASLGKYGEVMVDKSTGIPKISIPLLNLTESGMDIQIALSYHAGGIKVSDESSFVGLGWSLHAGGVITRVMRGMPDDGSSVGFLANALNIPRETWVEQDFNVPSYAEYIYMKLNELSNGKIDYEPDLFYYNAGHNSGSFIFGNHGYPVLIPYSDLSILPVYDTIFNTLNGITGFLITDQQGVQYYFGNIGEGGFTERTIYWSTSDNPSKYTSSFYLSKIYNPFSNSHISFKYTDHAYDKDNIDTYNILYESHPNNINFYHVSNNSHGTSMNINLKTISKIEFENDTVHFFSSISQEFLPKIDSIVFKNKVFEFEYGWYNPEETNCKRLKLLALKEKGRGEGNCKIHTFSYNETQLPPCNSFAIDHWGYFNNKPNFSLIPYFKIGNQLLGSGANREPDSAYTKAGILDRITYPTGGWTKFYFENNTCQRHPTIYEVSTDSLLTYQISGKFKDTLININLNPEYEYYDINISASIFGHSHCDCNAQNDMCDGDYEITDANEISYGSALPTISPCTYSINSNIESFKPPLELSLRILETSKDSTKLAVSISFRYYDPEKLTIKREFLTGGLRIKRTENFDSITGLLSTRSYDYATGGTLTFNEDLSYFTQHAKSIRRSDPNNPESPILEYPQVLAFSYPYAGLGLSSNIVSYSKVVEYFGTQLENNGKVESYFYEISDPPKSGPPYPPKVSNQYLRSNLIKEYFYSSKDDTIKSIEFKYEIDMNRRETVAGFQAFRKQTRGPTVSPPFHKDDFIFRNYWISPIVLRKKINKTTEYFDGEKIVTTDTLYYDSLYHFGPNRVISNRSDGKMSMIKYKYPLDHIDCKNHCLKDFISDVEDCELSYFGGCSMGYTGCQNIYSSCLSELITKLANARDVCCNKLQVLCWKKRFINYCIQDYIIEYQECLSDSGYYECLDTNSCFNLLCISDAKNSYLSCLFDYDSCLWNQLDNAIDDNQRGNVILALMHNLSTYLDKESYLIGNDTVKVEHLKYSLQVKEIEILDGDTLITVNVPVVSTAENFDFEHNTFNKEIQYDYYDDHLNIIQITPKGIGTPISYLWGYNSETFHHLGTAIHNKLLKTSDSYWL